MRLRSEIQSRRKKLPLKTRSVADQAAKMLGDVSQHEFE
jgi:hypothetical protein